MVTLLMIMSCVVAGISLEFAATMFSTWLKEKDINAICAALKKQQIDSRLMVGDLIFFFLIQF